MRAGVRATGQRGPHSVWDTMDAAGVRAGSDVLRAYTELLQVRVALI